MRPPFLLLPATAALAILPSDQDRNVKLNEPLAPRPTGSVVSFEPTPDGSHVVFEMGGLFSVPADGSAGQIELFPEEVADYVVTPDGTRVVYRYRASGPASFELFSVPVDGSAPPTKLSGTLQPNGDVKPSSGTPFALISPDGSRVVYRADADQDEVYELFSAPVDGSLPPTKLNPDYAGIQDVETFQLSSDSSFAVYSANQDLNYKFELYRVPLDGSGPDFKVSDFLVAGGTVSSDFRLTSDDSTVVYRAEQDANNFVEIYSVPLDGTRVSTKLCNALDVSRDVINFNLSADGLHVAYRIREIQPGPDDYELWQRPVSGPGPLDFVSLSGGGYEFSANGSWLVFEDHFDDLRTVSISGGTPQAISFRAVRWGVSGNRVLYTEHSYGYDLFSRPADRSLPAVQLNAAKLVSSSSWSLSSDGSLTAFASEIEGRTFTSVAPVNGSAAAQPVHDGSPRSIEITADNARLIVLDDARIDWLDELFSVPTDASQSTTRLSAPNAIGFEAHVAAFEIAPDGQRAVYLGEGEQGGVNELYSVPVDGSAAALRLNSPPVALGQILDFAISPDSANVVYRGDQDTDGVIELFSVPIDGSATPTKLSDVLDPSCVVCLVSGYQITSDGGTVVFRAAQDPGVDFELYGVPLDGSSPATRLNADLPVDVSLTDDDFQVAPDGSRAVYRLDLPNGMDELYSVPVSGGVAPDRIDVSSVPHRGARNFEISGDSTRVVFTARRDAGQGIDSDLYSTPLDGSVPAVKIGGASDLSDTVGDFVISPDSAVVVYELDEDSLGDSLWSVPLDGSSAPTALRDALQDLGRVRLFRVRPDSQQVGFVQFVETFVDPNVISTAELFTVPVDGSAPPVKLNAPLAEFGDVGSFGFTPDSGRIVYVADQDVDQVEELFSVPAEGGTVGRVSQGLINVSHPFEDFRISPDSRYVLYFADPFSSGSVDLFATPVEGGLTAPVPLQVNEPLVEDGELVVGGFAASPDSSRVLYLAQQEAAEMTELFATFLVPEVATIAPNRGPATGGNTVTLRGGGFTPATTVTFGGRPATSVTYVDAAELRVVVPPNLRFPSTASGAPTGRLRRAVLQDLEVDVRVSTRGIGSTLEAGYSYSPEIRLRR